MSDGVLARPTIELLGDDQSFIAALAGAQDALEAAGAKMQRIGGALSAAITLPLAAIGYAAGRAAIDFESSFAGIRKTMDLTEAEFGRLSDANRALAKTIPVSVNELNRIGELAGQLGISGVDNVLKFEDTIAKLAVTTDLTAEQGALAFAQIANVMRLPQQEIDRLGSVIVGLGNRFATVESRIVDFTQRIAGAGKIARLTFGDVAGIATAFASVGLEAEAGGTAVQKVILDIQAAVIKGGKELASFASTAGMSAEQFAALFRENASEAFVSFVEGLARQGEGAISTLEALGLSNERTRTAFLAAAGAGDVLRRAIAQGNAEWSQNNALTIEAEKRFETSASRLTVLRNRIYDASITIGQAFIPALVQIGEALAPLIDLVARAAVAFSSLPAPVQGVALALVVLAAAAGPVLLAVGGIVSILPTFKAGMAAAALPLTALATRLGTAWSYFVRLAAVLRPTTIALAGVARVVAAVTSPVGLMVSALSLAVAAWFKWSDTIALTARATANVLRVWLAPAFAFIGDLFKKAVAAAQWFYQNAIAPVVAFAKGVVSWIAGVAGEAFMGYAKLVATALGIFIPPLKWAAEKFREFADDVAAEMQRITREADQMAARVAHGAAAAAALARIPRTQSAPAGAPPPAMTTEIDKVQEALTNLNAELAANRTLQAALGPSFNKAAEDATAYRTAIDALALAGVGLNQKLGSAGQSIAGLSVQYNALQAGMTAAAAVNTLTAALQMNGQMAAALGETFDLSTANLDAYKNAIDALVAAGVPMNAQLGTTGKTLGDLITQWKALAAALKAANEQRQAWAALEAEGARVTEEFASPQERLIMRQEQLTALLEFGAISWETYQRAMNRATADYNAAISGASRVGTTISSVAQLGVNAMADFAAGSSNAFKSFVDSAIRELARLAAKLVAFKVLSFLLPGADKVIGTVLGIPGRARGGAVQAGRPYMVGERGPELFVPDAAAQIVPNHQLGGGTFALDMSSLPPYPKRMTPDALATDDFWRTAFSHLSRDFHARGGR